MEGSPGTRPEVAVAAGLPKRPGRPVVHALLDDPLLDALGFPRPPAELRYPDGYPIEELGPPGPTLS